MKLTKLLLLQFLSLDVNTSNARKPPNALFWVIAQQVVVIPYRRFGTTYVLFSRIKKNQ
jgi:hypothetical protein